MKHVLDALCGARFPSMNVLLFGKVGAWLLVIIGLVLMPQLLYADYCLKSKPPRGMPKRCHSLKITVPPVKSQLREKVVNWMATCAQKSRAESLVTYSSIDTVWEMIGSHRGKKFTLVPNYTPFTFKKNGKTCYGIEKVAFRLAEYKPGVVTEGDAEISTKPTDRQFVSVARRAEDILKAVNINNLSKDDVAGFRRMKCVVRMMNFEGPRLNEIYDYYPVAPLTKEVAPCSRRSVKGKIKCRKTGKDVIKNCKTSFSETLWQKASIRSDKEVLNLLLNLDSEIISGLAFIDSIYGMGKQFGDSKAMFCKSEQVLIDNMNRKLHREVSIYNCYVEDTKFDAR